MRVAVIGAGAAGLSATKALVEIGISPVVFEALDRVGGLWVYRENGDGPAYRSLRTNTSKEITAFSDRPFDAALPSFPSRSEVEAYLGDYTLSFDLLRTMRFGCRVRSLHSVPGGGWELAVECAGVTSTYAFDAVLICTGIFRRAAIPKVCGLEHFRGQVLHSIQYRVPDAFAGRNVVVVGLGSSAVDIAGDLTSRAGSVTLSTRRGAWIRPRTVAGRPLDHLGSRFWLRLPTGLRERYRQHLVDREFERRKLLQPAEIWEAARIPFDPERAPSVAGDELLLHIAARKVLMQPGIKHVRSDSVVFASGTSTPADALIFCTGYDLEFPFLQPELRPWTADTGGLYRLVFPPNHPSLAFIGVCRAHGPILPIVEMQARWAVRVLAGKITLPEPSAMQAEIDARIRRQAAVGDSAIRVALVPYQDELGAEIGTRPRIWRHPALAIPLLTGPPVAAQYRLEGPGVWDGAGDAIRNAAHC